MKKNNTFRRAAALLAALSITVSLAAPAFAKDYYLDDGNITIEKNLDGSQTVQQGTGAAEKIGADEEIIISNSRPTMSLESDLEGPAAEDSGFGPVVEDNYQPAQPEDAEEPKDADQPESTEKPEGADQPESAEEPEAADQHESAEQAAPSVSGNIIKLINNIADKVLNVTLKDVKIDVSNDGKAALSVQGNGNVEIELDGNNELKSGVYKAGLEKTSTGTLTLKDDQEPGSGSLKAEGGKSGAGIGGSASEKTNNITITGGTVDAIGGKFGAGIGGGHNGSGENITITGGTVNATGGELAAGIGGGGEGGSGNNIAITGGTVTAKGGISGAGIGGGFWSKGNGNITVSGAAQVTAVAGKGMCTHSGTSFFEYAPGASIGDGHNPSTNSSSLDEDGNWRYGSGKEIQADISGLTTGYIHHVAYDGMIIKTGYTDVYVTPEKDWWEYGRPQPAPDTPDTPNAPAEEGNEVSLGTPLLHVETLEGVLLPFNARQQGSTLTVTSDKLAARLHGTREALEALREQGVEQIEFVTTLKTTTLPVAELLAEGGGSWFALEHNGLVSRRLSAAQAESLKCQLR